MPTKLSLPLTLICSLLAGAAGAGGGVALTKDKVDTTAATVEQLVKEREIVNLRLQSLEIQLRYQSEALDRIERKLGTR